MVVFKIKRLIVIYVFFFITGCIVDPDENTDIKRNEKPIQKTLLDTFNLPLDTAYIISLFDFKLKDQIENLDERIQFMDTIELTSVTFACDCQDWVSDEYWQNEDLGEHGYFIEPFNDSMALDQEIGVFGNKVRFIGRYRTVFGENIQTKLTDSVKVFNYCAYEVILPIKVYGPPYYTGKTEIPGDTVELIMPSKITITKASQLIP